MLNHLVVVFFIYFLRLIESNSIEYTLRKDGNFSCWQDTENCVIKAKLWFATEISNSEGVDDNGNNNRGPLSVNINCSEDVVDTVFNQSSNNLFLKKYENIQKIVMNGCDVAAAADTRTFGLEFVPNYPSISDVTFEYFKIERFRESAVAERNEINRLCFCNNSVKNIFKNSFKNLDHVRSLYLVDNGLKVIESGAFKNLTTLEELIIRETDLFVDYDTISNKNLKSLALSVRMIETSIFQNLPAQLVELNVSTSGFNEDEFSIVSTETLKDLRIVDNKIKSIAIIDLHTLQNLNLSGNYLSDVILKNCTNLRVIDLSGNMLQHLSAESFSDVRNLRHVYLHDNQFIVLEMNIFRPSENLLTTLDLRDNNLRLIVAIDEYIPHHFLKIWMNGNPWNCKWLLDISNRKPELFGFFKYEKFISRINVNGLECVSYLEQNIVTSTMTVMPKINSRKLNPAEFPKDNRRNQKAEAMAVVLILLIGVAFLSFLLYLWIKCQKMFHLSFYRSFPRRPCSADRCDIVRNMNNETLQYEAPVQCPQHSNGKKLEVTYEEVPAPLTIYEELH